MARYTGPVCRLCRRYGEKLYLKGDRCFSPKCAFDRRPTPPGSASNNRRRKVSDRGLQLREKQRARVYFGLLERQFRSYYEEALRNADSANELRLAMKLKSKRGEPPTASGPTLSFDKEPTAEELEALREAERVKQAQRKRELEDQELERRMKEKGVDSRFGT